MKDHKIHNELKDLLQDKGHACISMIFPLHADASFARSENILLRYAKDKLLQLMQHLYPVSLVESFIEQIEGLEGKLDLTAGCEGVGIFISPRTVRVVQFPFEVKEKIAAGDTFELRDVMYKEFYLQEYFLLNMNTREAHLFKGRGSSFSEIKNKDFPAVFVDDYEYEKPSLGNSFGHTLKQFEKDKSIGKEQRMEAFYHEVDKKLEKYLHTETPLVIAGVEKDLGYFEKRTVNKEIISGKVTGSYDGYNSDELRSRVWNKMKEYFAAQENKVISELQESFGKGLVTYGLQQVWRDAKEGKGNVLVVEKDLTKPGFITEDAFQLHLTAPAGDHKIISDAVDDIIEMVYRKNGRIVFTDNGRLKDFEGIALIKRYV